MSTEENQGNPGDLSAGKPQVLVIEDNIDMREFLRRVLVRHGYGFLEAADGMEGVAIAREQHPQLILMDLSLPRLDGLEATRLIKADPDLSAIPVVAVTAHARPADEERAMEVGCDGYLSKPYSLGALVEMVKRYIADVPNQPDS